MDHLIKGTIPGIRAFAAVTTKLTEQARRRHDCSPVCTAALGRTMTAATLLAANLKTDESITIRISGDGPSGEIVADAEAGTVRGYVANPYVELPIENNKLPVGKAVGNGMIHVTRFTGLKHPFTGSAALISGEIAEDLTNYLFVSEQTPSSVALGVLVNPNLSVAAAGGFLVQPLPGFDDNRVIAKLEKNLSSLLPVSTLIQQGAEAEDLLKYIFSGLDLKILDRMPLQFRCRCSRQRVENMLISLGREELTDMIEKGTAEVICHFCRENYQFTKDDLTSIYNRLLQQE